MTATASPQVNLNVREPDDHILEALGWNPLHPADPDPDPGDFLYVHRDGIATAPGSPEWISWVWFRIPPLFAIA